MPKFAANLTMLFTEVPFMQRFKLAKNTGFKVIEYQFPYGYDVNELKAQLKDNNLKQVLFNLPAGDWSAGDRGIAAHPDRIEEFRSGIEKAVIYAENLGVQQVNCLAGTRMPQVSYLRQWTVLCENIRYAAEIFTRYGLKLLVEPINHFDMPAFFLNRADQVLRLIDDVDMPNVYMQYDIYHGHKEQEDIIATLENNIDHIAHMQIADDPGRHEPGTGEIDFPGLFRQIDALNYQGYVGLEYIPAVDTKSSVGWISDFGYRL